MRTVAVLNLKGGVGKTTLCFNLARGLELAGHRVVVLDTDPQGSAIDWSYAGDRREGDLEDLPDEELEAAVMTPALPPLVLVGAVSSVADLTASLHELKRGRSCDVALIDGAPHEAAIAAAAANLADVVLIPVQPSPLDIWATDAVVQLVRNARRRRRRKPKAAFVVWRMIPRTKLAADVVKALGAFKLPVLPVHVHQRVAYAVTAIDGRTVLDSRPGSAAAAEMRSLTQAVEDLF